MSLLQQIKTADSRTSGWSGGCTFYIYEMNFPNRKAAEDAFEELQPYYNEIWEKGVWEGIEKTTGQTTHTNKTSAYSHLWVDENNDGFSLCVLFSNTEQRNEIFPFIEIFYKDHKHHVHGINESEIGRIRELKKATHSVEIDIFEKDLNLDIVTDFMNVAMTSASDQKTLYVDTIKKDGFRRLKAYFSSDRAAQNFAQVADLKIRQPLLKLKLESIPEVKVREFAVAIKKPALKVA